MNNLNVFNNPKLPLRYPSNWIKTARMFFKSFKYAYQRATRGYADCDIWNMDNWLLDLLHNSLNYFADNHWGYPGTEEFDTDEKWTTYLKDMAQKFYQANERNEYYPTPEADKWWEYFEKHPSHFVEDTLNGVKLNRFQPDADNPYVETMLQEDRENAAKRHDDAHEAFTMLDHVVFSLWD